MEELYPGDWRQRVRQDPTRIDYNSLTRMQTLIQDPPERWEACCGVDRGQTA